MKIYPQISFKIGQKYINRGDDIWKILKITKNTIVLEGLGTHNCDFDKDHVYEWIMTGYWKLYEN